MRKLLLFFAGFAFILLILSYVGAKNGINPGADVKVEKDVEKQLDKNDRVNVIITLKENSGQNLISGKADIEGLIPKSRQFRDNSMIAEITLDELENLKRSGKIESVEYNRPVHVFLQEAVVIMNASKTWNAVNGLYNLTGLNQTICIIDTGINYSHGDLGGCYGGNNATSNCKVLGGYNFVNNDNDPMDDNDHGTHVAGIASARGNISGIAPDSKLIVIKSLNSAGTGTVSDIVSGIDWCVGNSSNYGIKVISMSLGTDEVYNGYCDSSYSTFVSAINSAYAKNITVIVATGNNGNTTAISSPACIQNATPIAATDKSDAIASYSNYNSIVRLFTTGSNINSTKRAGGYQVNSGTSMAAPMAAGAFALMYEYLNLTGKTRTPKQMEAIFNQTGKNFSSNGINFSRINIFNAITSIDTDNPNVTLISPGNNSYSINQNQTFSCNATDLALKNATFILWNSTSSVYNQTSRNITGSLHVFEINATNLSADAYKWNCLFADENNNTAFALSSNFTLNIISLAVNLTSPLSDSFTNQNQTFICNATTTNTLSNVTFYLWNSTGLENTTFRNLTGTSNSTNITYNFTHEGTYLWNCLTYTNVSTFSFASSNSSIVYDLVSPITNITLPFNNSIINGRFNVTLNENGSCLYTLNGGILNYSMTASGNRNFTATNNTLLQGANHTIIYYCNDSSGNLNISSRLNFSIDLSAPNINLVSPANSYSETSSSASVAFSFNFADNLNVTSCNLILNGAVSQTNLTSSTNASLSLTSSLTPGSYTWNINCSDSAGNTGNSTSRTLTINAPSSGTSGGAAAVASTESSGGAAAGSKVAATGGHTYSPSKEEIIAGYSKDLKVSDKIKVTFFDSKNENHTLTIDSVFADRVELTIASEPIKVTLGVGQSIKLNMTSGDFYDLFVKLDSILNGSAKLTVQIIREPILSAGSEGNESVSLSPESEGVSDWLKYKYYIFITIFAIILVALIVHFVDKLHEKKVKDEIIDEIKKGK